MPNVKVEPDTASSITALEYISLQSDPTAAQSNLPGVPQANTHDQLHALAERKIQGKRILNEQSVLPRDLRSMADIDTACKIIVQNMNAKKEFVSSSKIELALLQYYGKRQLGDFGIGNVRAAHQIETLKNLNMRERKVVLYVELFIKVSHNLLVGALLVKSPGYYGTSFFLDRRTRRVYISSFTFYGFTTYVH